jgi:hypothetical protein
MKKGCNPFGPLHNLKLNGQLGVHFGIHCYACSAHVPLRFQPIRAFSQAVFLFFFALSLLNNQRPRHTTTQAHFKIKHALF